MPVIPHPADDDDPADAADTFDFVCPVMVAPAPGEDLVPCWTSKRWPTVAAAQLRGDEHMIEHKTGKPAPELAESAAKTGAKLPADRTKMAKAAHREATETGRVAVELEEDEQ